MTVRSVAYSFNVTGSASKAKTTFELTALSPDEFELLSVKPESVKHTVSLNGRGEGVGGVDLQCNRFQE